MWIMGLLLAAASPPAANPPAMPWRCDAPTASDWLTQVPAGLAGMPSIDERRVVPVRRGLAGAIARLRRQSAVRLTRSEASRLTGSSAAPRGSLRPWLVRNVFPTAAPMVSAKMQHGELIVIAAGVGCAPYVKHPVVLWLRRAPSRVFVMASGAL